MRKNTLFVAALLVLAVVFALSCTIKQEKPFAVVVDVNVRIDVYQHASDVLDYIHGESETLPEIKPKSSSLLDGALDILFGVRTASAAENPDLQKYRELIESMKKRAGKVLQYKNDQSVGENHKGLLSVRESNKMKSDPKYAEAGKKLVNDENRDRKQFYELSAKMHNKSYDEIAKTFAKARRDKSKPGHWIEVKKGDRWLWQKK